MFLWDYFFGPEGKTTERYIINKYSKFDFNKYCVLEQVTRVRQFDKDVFTKYISSILSGHFKIEEDGNLINLYSDELQWVTKEHLNVDISYFLNTFGNIVISKNTFVEYTELFIYGK